MDIDSLAKGVGIFGSAITAFKQALDLLPNNSKKEEAAEALGIAERQFKTAEATIASKLDYEICRDHFPPVIMLSKDDMNWRCPVCNNTKYTGPYEATVG